MSQNEIPPEYWQTFCKQFTLQHQSWIVNLSVGNVKLGPETTAEEAEHCMKPMIRMAVFQSITAEHANGDYIITIIAGTPPEQVAHNIYNPSRLFFRQTGEGAHEGLAIESGSGQNTLLRFRVAALPEILDGLTIEELATTSR